MPKFSLRESLLDAGLKTMFRTGYHGTSVRDIAEAAGAPIGSFTNHFKSKEAFACEVLDRYFDYVKTLVAQAFEDKSLTPRQRLMRYLEIITGKLEAAHYERGCLIGNFSLELTASNDSIRTRIDDIFRHWREPFAVCIAEGQAIGEIDKAYVPVELAEFILSSWHGAILRMKVERSSAPLERFKSIILKTIMR